MVETTSAVVEATLLAGRSGRSPRFLVEALFDRQCAGSRSAGWPSLRPLQHNHQLKPPPVGVLWLMACVQSEQRRSRTLGAGAHQGNCSVCVYLLSGWPAR